MAPAARRAAAVHSSQGGRHRLRHQLQGHGARCPSVTRPACVAPCCSAWQPNIANTSNTCRIGHALGGDAQLLPQSPAMPLAAFQRLRIGFVAAGSALAGSLSKRAAGTLSQTACRIPLTASEQLCISLQCPDGTLCVCSLGSARCRRPPGRRRAWARRWTTCGRRCRRHG